MEKVLIYYSDACLDHKTGTGHPEKPERISYIMDALEKTFTNNELIYKDVFPYSKEDKDYSAQVKIIENNILKFHTLEYIQRLKKSIPSMGIRQVDEYDFDTLVSSGSLFAAYKYVSAACDAVKEVIAGNFKRAFICMRPPGHHAVPDSQMGFCLFNNIAIAVLIALEGLNKVAIVDWDVHHGNGTQVLANANPNVLFISMHKENMWPGTGSRLENKTNILNIPIPRDNSNTAYNNAFNNEVVPTLKKFAPEIILISAGFDSHKYDPMVRGESAEGKLNLTEEDYYNFTVKLVEIAEKYSNGRIISFLEGGYNLEALFKSIAEHIKGLIGRIH